MKEHLAFATGLLFAVIALARCFPPDKQVEAAAGYEAQQAACIAKFNDKPSIDACRDKVKAAWTAKDAGGDQ
jgi:hypothetical protein